MHAGLHADRHDASQHAELHAGRHFMTPGMPGCMQPRIHNLTCQFLAACRLAFSIFFRIILTNHGLGADKLGLLPVAKHLMVRHRALSRTNSSLPSCALFDNDVLNP